MTHAIRTDKLTKVYGDRIAVDALDLTVEQGELFSLLGLNGAGKTTTIRMLSCLLPPTSGDAVLLGDSITGDPQAVKQKINVSPQETAVASKLTVRENLELIARIYGSDKAQAAQKATDMMALFSLSDRENERAKKLSGGLARRLSIAMALISEPDIVFLDEPTLGLDVRARRDLWKILQTLKGKKTVVLTTHYLEEAETLSDRIAVMQEGRLRALGTAGQLKQQAGADDFEEAFLTLTEKEGL